MERHLQRSPATLSQCDLFAPRSATSVPRDVPERRVGGVPDELRSPSLPRRLHEPGRAETPVIPWNEAGEGGRGRLEIVAPCGGEVQKGRIDDGADCVSCGVGGVRGAVPVPQEARGRGALFQRPSVHVQTRHRFFYRLIPTMAVWERRDSSRAEISALAECPGKTSPWNTCSRRWPAWRGGRQRRDGRVFDGGPSRSL